MAKGSTQELLRALVKTLSESPKSINEIAEATGFDRIAITKYLEILKGGGILSETSDGRRRVFELRTQSCIRKDTYFGLPLEEGQERTIDSIYSLIKQKWYEKTKRYPTQVQAQKNLFKVNKICNLNLPMGWYLFGALCVKPYNPRGEYSNNGLAKEVEGCIEKVVVECTRDVFAYQAKIRQYEEEKNRLYLTKEEILRILHSCDFSKRFLGLISKKLRELFGQAPQAEDAVYHTILDEYPYLITQLMTTLDDKNIDEIHPEMTGSFEDIWKLIALYNYRNGLETGKFYTKRVLDEHFAVDILQQENEIIERCSYLQSLLPPEEEPNDKVYREIKGIVAKMGTHSGEERTRRKAEIEKIRSENGEGALQEHILKKLGVNHR